MTESSMPFAAAIVAAPILKLCEQYFDWSMPASYKACRTACANRARVKGRPSLNTNNGPGVDPRTLKKLRTAATGHRCSCPQPTYGSTPFRNGSIFNCLMVIFKQVGRVASSTARFWTHKCAAGSYPFSVGTLISPARKNAKKKKQEAAHNILVSKFTAEASHTAFIFNSIGGVIGRRGLCLTPFSTSRFLVTYSRRGKLSLNGSDMPASICKWRTADR